MATNARRRPYLNRQGVKERGVYTIETARDGLVFEIGWRDAHGAQRWRRRVDQSGPLLKTVTAARAELAKVLAAKDRGECGSADPRLTFGDAADAWLEQQVSQLRAATRTNYRNSINHHVRPRWGNRRMDAIDVTDAAQLVRDLRADGLAEWTIAGITRAAARVFKFARRHCGWRGENPFPLLENGERARLSETPERRVYEGTELAETIAVADEPWQTVFRLANVVGARESELLGLWWSDMDLSDLDAATIRFTHQVDRDGQRVSLKTEESKALLPLPRSTAVMMLEHNARSAHSGPRAFVFSTVTGRALGQRNLLRALYRAQAAARTADGHPTFPDLFEHDKQGHLIVNAKGAFVRRNVKRRDLNLPDFHAIRHAAAMDCDDAEEARDLLRHKDSTVTRQVYRAHFGNQRRELLRAKMEARHGGADAEAFTEAHSADGRGSDGSGGAARVVRIHGDKPDQGADAA